MTYLERMLKNNTRINKATVHKSLSHLNCMKVQLSFEKTIHFCPASIRPSVTLPTSSQEPYEQFQPNLAQKRR